MLPANVICLNNFLQRNILAEAHLAKDGDFQALIFTTRDGGRMMIRSAGPHDNGEIGVEIAEDTSPLRKL